MPLTRLESALIVVITVLALWAHVWVHAMHRLRGPLSYPALSVKADVLDELPPDWLALADQDQ